MLVNLPSVVVLIVCLSCKCLAGDLLPDFEANKLPKGYKLSKSEVMRKGVRWLRYEFRGDEKNSGLVIYSELQNMPSNYERGLATKLYIERLVSKFDKDGYQTAERSIPKPESFDYKTRHIATFELESRKGHKLFVENHTFFSDYGHTVFIASPNIEKVQELSTWARTLKPVKKSGFHEKAKQLVLQGKSFRSKQSKLQFRYSDKTWFVVTDAPSGPEVILHGPHGAVFVVIRTERDHTLDYQLSDAINLFKHGRGRSSILRKQGLMLGDGEMVANGLEVGFLDTLNFEPQVNLTRHYFLMHENDVYHIQAIANPRRFREVEPFFLAMLGTFAFSQDE